jgi:AcrR family transcriptional regulator
MQPSGAAEDPPTMSAANRRSDGERTRERVLDEALPLFAKHGYAGTSIRMIARAAEVNVATLAYHFGDKDGLYTTVVQRLHEDLTAAFPSPEAILQAVLEPDGTLRTDSVVRRLIEVGWAFCLEHRQHNRLLLRHVLDAGALPEVVVSNWSRALMDRVVDALRLARPELTPERIRTVVSGVQHLLVRWSLEDPAQFAVILGLDGEGAESPSDEEMGRVVVDFLERVARSELGL